MRRLSSFRSYFLSLSVLQLLVFHVSYGDEKIPSAYFSALSICSETVEQAQADGIDGLSLQEIENEIRVCWCGAKIGGKAFWAGTKALFHLTTYKSLAIMFMQPRQTLSAIGTSLETAVNEYSQLDLIEAKAVRCGLWVQTGLSIASGRAVQSSASAAIQKLREMRAIPVLPVATENPVLLELKVANTIDDWSGVSLYSGTGETIPGANYYLNMATGNIPLKEITVAGKRYFIEATHDLGQQSLRQVDSVTRSLTFEIIDPDGRIGTFVLTQSPSGTSIFRQNLLRPGTPIPEEFGTYWKSVTSPGYWPSR